MAGEGSGRYLRPVDDVVAIKQRQRMLSLPHCGVAVTSIQDQTLFAAWMAARRVTQRAAGGATQEATPVATLVATPEATREAVRTAALAATLVATGEATAVATPVAARTATARATRIVAQRATWTAAQIATRRAAQGASPEYSTLLCLRPIKRRNGRFSGRKWPIPPRVGPFRASRVTEK